VRRRGAIGVAANTSTHRTRGANPASPPGQCAGVRPSVRTLWPGSVLGVVEQGCAGHRFRGMGEAGMQVLPDLLRGIGTSAPLGPHDEHAGGRDSGQSCQTYSLTPSHAPRLLTMAGTSIALDQAAAATRTGDLWLFRGHSAADRVVRISTNSPVNHVGMSVVIDDLPALMWHAELGRSLPDVWSGTRQRGAQLHDLQASVKLWTGRYAQRAWLRQLDRPITREMEDAVLRTVARLDGTPFPSTARLASQWLGGRIPRRRRNTPQPALETAYCAEIVAATYQDMGLLQQRQPGWYDAGRFWSGDGLALCGGYRLEGEIAVCVPSPN
jgi:hypothetical protein